jgi:hypothetical protein
MPVRPIARALAGTLPMLAFAAIAQTTPAGMPERINGTIDRFGGQTLSVHAGDGKLLAIVLPDSVRVGAVADRRSRARQSR